jgi:hypothetical protein
MGVGKLFGIAKSRENPANEVDPSVDSLVLQFIDDVMSLILDGLVRHSLFARYLFCCQPLSDKAGDRFLRF